MRAGRTMSEFTHIGIDRQRDGWIDKYINMVCREGLVREGLVSAKTASRYWSLGHWEYNVFK